MKRPDSDWESRLSETPLGTGGFSMGTIRKVKERIAVQEKRQRSKAVPLAVAAVLVVILAAALFRSQFESTPASRDKTETEKKPVISDTETTTLKIAYSSGSKDFMQKYGDPFVIRHPRLAMDFADNAPKTGTLEEYKKWIETENPDLVRIPIAYLDDLSAAGLLIDLDSLLLRDGIDEQSYFQPVQQMIREAGAGKLYGLTDTFQTYGLFYNRKLFAERGVSEPTGFMTWEEIMNVAARFAGTEKDSKPVYGLSFGGRSDLPLAVLEVGQSLGLGTASSDGRQSTLGSQAWTSLWSSFIQGYRDNWIAHEKGIELGKSYALKEMYKLDPFLNGRSAMTFAPSDYTSSLEYSRKELGFSDEWGIVSAPALDESSRARGQTLDVPSSVFAIPASSSRSDAAWELLKYIMSPEQAERRYRTAPSALFTVRSPAIDTSGPQASFYEGSYDTSLSLSSLEQQITPAYQALLGLAHKAGGEKLNDLAAGSLTVDQFLKDLDAQAEETLQQLAAGKAAGQ